jgi:hypothetical protein
MRKPAHAFLEEFPSDRSPAAKSTVLSLRPRALPAPSEPDPALARVGEAYARGYEEGRSAARKEGETRIAGIEAGHQVQLEAARRQFSHAIVAELSDKLRARMEELDAMLADQAVAALLPLLRHALTAASVREMAEGLSAITRDKGAVVVELSGPKDLIELVWERYRELTCGQKPGRDVRFRIAETVEMRAVVDETVIEARLMEWVARIMEAVG